MSFDREIKCPGCGSPFQTDDPQEAGYLPAGKVPEDGIVCRRCFQMRHYGVFTKATIRDRTIRDEIRQVSRHTEAIFMVLDVAQFEVSSSALDWVTNLNQPVFTVVNKCDLLRDRLDRGEIAQWTAARIGVPEHRVFPVSATAPGSVAELRRRIEAGVPPGSALLFLGTTNVGKSTLLRALSGDQMLTVSRLPGTTLGVSSVTARNGLRYVDVPGLKESNPWLGRLCPDCLISLVPQRKLKNLFFVMRAGQALAFGGMGWLVMDRAGVQGWARLEAFSADGVTLHRTSASRLKELLSPYRSDILTPPCPSCWSSLDGPGYLSHEMDVREGEDLVLPGCGWLAVRTGRWIGRFFLPGGVAPVVRPSLAPSLAKKTGRRRR